MVKSDTTVRIYVEGGGNGNALRTACREAFAKFFEGIELDGKKLDRPSWVACGSRNDAFESFCMAVRNGQKNAMLLVDSEDEVEPTYSKPPDYSKWRPFAFLQNRDKWKMANVDSTGIHLMVRNMEAWLVADIDNLKRFYRQGFNDKQLSRMSNHVETIDRHELIKALETATMKTTKGKYGKGRHSFKLLASTDPNKVMKVSPWAKRFVECLKAKLKERS